MNKIITCALALVTSSQAIKCLQAGPHFLGTNLQPGSLKESNIKESEETMKGLKEHGKIRNQRKENNTLDYQNTIFKVSFRLNDQNAIIENVNILT